MHSYDTDLKQNLSLPTNNHQFQQFSSFSSNVPSRSYTSKCCAKTRLCSLPSSSVTFSCQPQVHCPEIIIKELTRGPKSDQMTLEVSDLGQGTNFYGPQRKPKTVLKFKSSKPVLLQRIWSKLNQKEFQPELKDIDKNQHKLLKDLMTSMLPDPKKPMWYLLKRPMTNNHRFLWDIIVLTFIFIDLVFMPVEISFHMLADFITFEYIIFGVYVCDIIVNFHIARYHEGIWIDDHHLIAKIYIRSWLIIDVIAAFPYFTLPWLRPNEADWETELTWGLFRLLRLVKVFRLNHISDRSRVLRRLRVRIASSSGQIFLRLVKIGFIAFVISNWMGCIYHYIATIESLFYDGETWIKDHDLGKAHMEYRYVISLYWAFETFTSDGFGNMAAVTRAEKLFAIFAMLVGAWIFSYILSTVANITHEITKERLKGE